MSLYRIPWWGIYTSDYWLSDKTIPKRVSIGYNFVKAIYDKYMYLYWWLLLVDGKGVAYIYKYNFVFSFDYDKRKEMLKNVP